MKVTQQNKASFISYRSSPIITILYQF